MKINSLKSRTKISTNNNKRSKYLKSRIKVNYNYIVII